MHLMMQSYQREGGLGVPGGPNRGIKTPTGSRSASMVSVDGVISPLPAERGLVIRRGRERYGELDITAGAGACISVAARMAQAVTDALVKLQPRKQLIAWLLEDTYIYIGSLNEV